MLGREFIRGGMHGAAPSAEPLIALND